MILSWMAYAMLCAALCAIAGAAVDSMLHTRLEQRRAVWIASLVASVVLPLVVPVILPPDTAAPVIEVPMTMPVAENISATATPAASPHTLSTIAALAWAMSSTFLVALLIYSKTRLARRLRAYRTAHVDGLELLVSDDFGPAIVGWMHPRIVLPAWALALSESDRRLVLSHEQEHQRARDPVVTLGALLLVALFPWNAALWWQLSRLRLAIEFDCDARVVSRSGANPFDYGNLLVVAHENTMPTRFAALALAPIRSSLGKRINALVTRSAPSRTRAAGGIGVLLMACAVLGFAPAPRFPRVDTVPRRSLAADVASNAGQLQRREVNLVELVPGDLKSASHVPSNMHAPSTVAGQVDAVTSTLAAYRDVPANVVVRGASGADRTTPPARVLTSAEAPAYRFDSVSTRASATSPVENSHTSGTFSVTRPSSESTVQVTAVAQVVRGGTLIGGFGGSAGPSVAREPLKSYTGGFMNAEVPRDSTRPPVR